MTTRPTRVAVVDDDQSVCTALSRLLRTSGIETDTYASGIELIGAMELARPDCIVLDLQMPDFNGLDVLRLFQRMGTKVPVIVMTAHDENASRDACLEAGASAYLRKPLAANTLLAAILVAIH